MPKLRLGLLRRPKPNNTPPVVSTQGSHAQNVTTQQSIPTSGDLQITNDAFQMAYDEFTQLLPPTEKKFFLGCSNTETFMAKLEDLARTPNTRMALDKITKRVDSFNKSLEPFISTLSLISQGHPYAAITWGSVLLAFKLASNHASFFEKLASTLDDLGRHLPRYDNLISIWKKYSVDPSPRLKASLQSTYTLLFQFLRDLIFIFTKNGDTSVSKTRLSFRTSWKPFDVRFQSFKDHLLVHRELIEKELRLSIYEGSLRGEVMMTALALSDEQKDQIRGAERRLEMIQRTTQNQHAETSFDRISSWLSPPNFKTEFENIIYKRTPETAQWLFNKAKFKAWIELDTASTQLDVPDSKFGTSVLWVSGNPGCGKTMLAASCVEMLSHHSESVYYYFFRQDQPETNDYSKAYKAILAQVLYSHKDDQEILDRFLFARSHLSSGQLTASTLDLLALLNLCAAIPSHNQAFLVLDGVDECEGAGRLVDDLQCLHRDLPLKLLFFSRPHGTPLNGMIDLGQHYHIDRENEEDLEKYFQGATRTMKDRRLLPNDADINQLCKHLVTGADGMFIWARLMIDYLMNTKSFSPAGRKKEITEVKSPEKLAEVYDRILKQLQKYSERDQAFARFVIMWLNYATRSLTTHEMREAVMVWTGQPDYDEIESPVLESCACLVETYELFNPQSKRLSKGFRLIHLTAREYIKETTHEVNILYVSPKLAHCNMATACLEYLLAKLPTHPLSGEFGTDVQSPDLDDRLPFCNYASANWIGHLSHMRVNDVIPTTQKGALVDVEQYQRLVQFVARFLGSPRQLAAWVETVFSFNEDLEHERLHKWSCELVKNLQKSQNDSLATIAQDCSTFAEELSYLKRDWWERLIESPCCVWLEVTAFGSFPHLGKSRVMRFASFSRRELPNVTTDQGKCLRELSCVSIDGLYLGKLTVFPSLKFTSLSEQERMPHLDELHSACEGWTARYEIWTTQSKPILQTVIQVSLEPFEVWLQLNQSFWLGNTVPFTSDRPKGLFKLQCPLAISGTLRNFIVFRDILQLGEEPWHFTQHFTTSRLDFDFDPDLADRWSNKTYGARLQRRTESLLWGCKLDDVLALSEAYLYYYAFSYDGRCLIYRDELVDSETVLVAFQKSIVDDRTWSLLCTGKKKLPQGQHSIVSFHPEQSLAALSYYGSVYLWAFRCSTFRLFLCHKEAIPRIRPPIGFSDNGNNVLIHNETSPVPIIYPLPEILKKNLRACEAVQDHNMHAYDSTTESQSSQVMTARTYKNSNPLATQLAKFSEHRILPINFSQTSPDGSAIGITTRHSESRITVQVWNKSDSDSRTGAIEITKLPRGGTSKGISPAILTPQGQDSRIRMVLNKDDTVLWTTPSEPDTRFPAIVSREIRSIKINDELKDVRLLGDGTNNKKHLSEEESEHEV